MFWPMFQKFVGPYACTCCTKLYMPDGKEAGYKILLRFQLANHVTPESIECAKAKHQRLIDKSKYLDYYKGVENVMLKETIEAANLPIGTCLVSEFTRYDQLIPISGPDILGF